MKYLKLLLSGLLLAQFSACASAPEAIERTDVQEIVATVIAVDAPSRMVTLRGPEGNVIRLEVSPEVRNLAQVQAGDSFRVSYHTAFVVAMAEPGNDATDLEIAAVRTPQGSRPGVAAGISLRETIEIISIGQDGKSVTFRNAEGELQSMDVPRDEGRAFAKKLQPGDLVDMEYSEAIAITIEPSD